MRSPPATGRPPLHARPDRLIEQFPKLAADRDSARLPGLAGRLVFLQRDDAIGSIHVGNRRPAELARSSATLP